MPTKTDIPPADTHFAWLADTASTVLWWYGMDLDNPLSVSVSFGPSVGGVKEFGRTRLADHGNDRRAAMFAAIDAAINEIANADADVIDAAYAPNTVRSDDGRLGVRVDEGNGCTSPDIGYTSEPND